MAEKKAKDAPPPAELSQDQIDSFLTTFHSSIDGGVGEGQCRLGRNNVSTSLKQFSINKDTIAPFTYIQPEIKALTRLEALRLVHCPLTDVAPVLGQLSTLTSLQAHHLLELETITPGFLDAVADQLVSLSVHDCRKVRAVPEEIAGLAKLETLTITQTGIQSVPEPLTSLPRLQAMYLFDNHLTALPMYWSLVFLRVLDVSRNELSTIPNGVCTCLQLRVFNASHNHLRRLPDDFGRLLALEDVDLSHNGLVELPSSIGFLRQMYRFIGSHNQLVNLPETSHRWTALQELDLQANALEAMPASLSKLSRLTDLKLRGNPLFDHRTDMYGRDMLELQLKRILADREREHLESAQEARPREGGVGMSATTNSALDAGSGLVGEDGDAVQTEARDSLLDPYAAARQAGEDVSDEVRRNLLSGGDDGRGAGGGEGGGGGRGSELETDTDFGSSSAI